MFHELQPIAGGWADKVVKIVMREKNILNFFMLLYVSLNKVLKNKNTKNCIHMRCMGKSAWVICDLNIKEICGFVR